ncbi:hypothetical protein NQ176_g8055 [Zarea fungicola]|uniref:Uncharacterized protein n=1 Tax=Zarea fungicola TaxID=93591 RepID=A0ACC1MUN1_9HYPO|nr:hypothetical protein NQ176_g8055 [Lecanicillium fungicola]
MLTKQVPATETPASGPGPTQPSSYADLHPPSPLLQGKNRETVTQSVQCPQPSAIPGLYENAHNGTSNIGAPAQVAALRSEPGSRTSPESSSQGGQNRRKNRRKKRKSDRQGLDNQQSFENSPQHIKSEPRSPSPIVGPSYLRPNKRQRHLKPQSRNTAFDEMAYDPAMPSVPANGNEGPQQPSYRQEQPSIGYEGSAVYSATGDGISTGAKASREYVTERVITDDGYRREYVSQPALPYEYSRGSHISRPVQQIVSRRDAYQDSPLSYRSSPQATRYSVLPEGDAFHEAARSQPARILVDAYGREYFEPATQIIRHSIAPSPLPVETERVYERAPPQPVSRYQGQGPFEERGYMFAQPASPYNAPRRIITQPEYITFDNRDGRYREFSARPLAASGEFVQVRSQEHRAYADGGREYISRASSMHPAEQTRISSGLGPYGHTSGVRPEASGVIYGIDPGLPLSGIKRYGPWPTSQGVVEREGGSGGFAATAANEGTRSRSALGQDPMYGRGNRSEGFR